MPFELPNFEKMKVKITPKFTQKQIRSQLQGMVKRLDDAVYMALVRAGEQFVADARNNNTYKDRTGNLRSSIGYIILQNGVQISESFEGFKDGVHYGKRAVEDIKGRFPRGYVLIGVAGMFYAAAVESRGFDVITSSAKQADDSLKKTMERITLKLNKL